MTITPSVLSRWSGIAAAAAGAIFIGVQINHPQLSATTITTTDVFIRDCLKMLMCSLALAGITGMYVSQVRRNGVLGFIGYLVLSAGYLAMFAVECIVGYVLPAVAESDPGYVQDVLDEAVGGAPSGHIGHMHELFLLSGIGYTLGGLLFGIALFRAGVLARWAAALLAIGTTSALALSVLPESFNRPFAVPTGVALLGLGLSLWRDQRRQVDTAPVAAPVEQPAVVR